MYYEVSPLYRTRAAAEKQLSKLVKKENDNFEVCRWRNGPARYEIKHYKILQRFAIMSNMPH